MVRVLWINRKFFICFVVVICDPGYILSVIEECKLTKGLKMVLIVVTVMVINYASLKINSGLI